MKLKNVVTKGLITLMACGMLTACQLESPSKGSESPATVAAESTDTSNADTSKVEVKEDTKDESKEVKEETKDASKEELKEETKDASKEDDSSKNQISEDIGDLTEHYKNYFDTFSMDHQLLDAKLEVSEEGFSMSMIIKAGQVGDSSFIEFGMDGGKGMSEILMYNDAEGGYLYFEEVFAGAGKKSYKSKNDDTSVKELTDSLAGDKTFGLDKETASKINYDRTEVIDGVTYDILLAKIEEGEGYYYINRDTQKLAKIEIPYEGQGIMEINVVDLDKIDFPASAEELKPDEIGEKMATDIMAIMFSSIDMDQLNQE